MCVSQLLSGTEQEDVANAWRMWNLAKAIRTQSSPKPPCGIAPRSLMTSRATWNHRTQGVQHMVTASNPRFWEPVAAGACVVLQEGSSTAHCTAFHQVFENTFNTLFQEICQERANIAVIYRPSYGLPYYCLESIRVGIYVLLWPFLPVQRTQTLWFSADLPLSSLLGRQE